ncbi:DNA mismatch repair protein MutL [Balneicella halophila]|uniref:DNA mismatch repair protein MutL n=1 Tax=Balneicella halophila TaxID=1537566 RepID=A0A7L4UQE0_BALHA|nr:DNA mismatch repair endonuclease MutL [Balneicella halophila]PVX51995.1 DNA mismatch repair protein MutL [Balneicella halophila]
MTDIIRVLPDAIANQIAAGEVVQRPASVVKELLDNALDAGATHIEIILEQAGKNLIKIIDNGKGMSMTDARMAFERHATSKIEKADDLFAIRTMGFRGEALASIAAVAHVELKTCTAEQELGTYIAVNGSELITQEPVNCPKGSQFTIKNLFFNIPARRKFLKTNATELRHIIQQVQRIALAYPEVSFHLEHDGNEIYQLPKTKLKQRIVHLFGNTIQTNLIAIQSETSYSSLEGYIGKPEKAKKNFGEQFFFANNRYIRHPYLHKAVMEAYGNLLPSESIPAYFIFINIDPNLLDVNIHPTKTEVKFEDERTLFQIVLATVKEALGKHNITPSIDFEIDRSFEIPTATNAKDIKAPEISVDPNFNPFKQENNGSSFSKFKTERGTKGWESFYDFEDLPMEDTSQQISFEEKEQANIGLFQVKGKYILSQVKSGLMIINQKRAHERIVFEQLFKLSKEKNITTQRLLFPHIISLSATEMTTFNEIAEELKTLGFDIDLFSKDSIAINGMPGGITLENPEQFIQDILNNYNGKKLLDEQLRKSIIETLAKMSSLQKAQSLSPEERQQLIDALFACNTPNHTPSGKKIVHILPLEEIDKYFS